MHHSQIHLVTDLWLVLLGVIPVGYCLCLVSLWLISRIGLVGTIKVGA